MTSEQPSRVSVEGPGDDVATGRSHRWLLPAVGLLVIGAIWSFRGDATPENDPLDLSSMETTTTTTEAPLTGDLSMGWVAIDLPGEGEVVELLDSSFGTFAAVQGSDGARLWMSGDGLNWTQVPDEEGVFLNAQINAMVETVQGLVAVGAQYDPESATTFYLDAPEDWRIPAVWVSGDGASWERIPQDGIGPSAAGSGEPDDEEALLGAMNDVLVWNEHLVAVGWSTSPIHAGAAWVAGLDGRSWRHATEGLDGGGSGFAEVQGVAVLDDLLVAVGSILTRPVAWVSSDGMAWTGLQSTTSLGMVRYDEPAGIVARPSGVVAVGTHRVGGVWSSPRVDYPVAWVSQDGREWVKLAVEDLEGAAFQEVVFADPWILVTGSHNLGVAGAIPAFWFSATAAEWNEIDLSVEGYEYSRSSVNSIAEAGPGLIAGGTVQGMPELWVWSSSGTLPESDGVWKRPETGRWVLRAEVGELPIWSAGRLFDGWVAFDDRAMWSSEDGVVWSSVPLSRVGLEPNRGYHRPVVIGTTAYVVDEEGSLWSSPDGRRWSLLTSALEGWLEGPFPGLDGELLLVHHGWERDRPRLLRSPEGVEWTEMTLPEFDWISEVHTFGDRYLILGWGWDPSLWWSTDGETWEEIDLVDLGDLADVLVFDDRILVLVVDYEGWMASTTLLVSDDGWTWERFDGIAPGWPGELSEYDGGLLLTVHEEEGAYVPRQSIWVSPDGAEWTQLGPLSFAGDAWVQTLPAGDQIRAVVEAEHQPPTLWEWVPPDEE